MSTSTEIDRVIKGFYCIYDVSRTADTPCTLSAVITCINYCITITVQINLFPTQMAFIESISLIHVSPEHTCTFTGFCTRGAEKYVREVRRPFLETKISPHYNDVIMSTMASQIAGVSIVNPTVCSGADQRKHRSSTSLASVRGIHRWPASNAEKASIRCRHHVTSKNIFKLTWCPT